MRIIKLVKLVKILTILGDDLIHEYSSKVISIDEAGFHIDGFRVQGSGFRVQGSGFRIQDWNVKAIWMEESKPVCIRKLHPLPP